MHSIHSASCKKNGGLLIYIYIYGPCLWATSLTFPWPRPRTARSRPNRASPTRFRARSDRTDAWWVHMTIPRAQANRRVHTVKYALSNLRGSAVQGLLLWSRRLWLVEVVGGGYGVRHYGCSTGGGYSVYVGMMYSIVCSRVWCMVSCGRVGGKQRRS